MVNVADEKRFLSQGVGRVFLIVGAKISEMANPSWNLPMWGLSIAIGPWISTTLFSHSCRQLEFYSGTSSSSTVPPAA